jgi:hypothetical protein
LGDAARSPVTRRANGSFGARRARRDNAAFEAIVASLKARINVTGTDAWSMIYGADARPRRVRINGPGRY